MWDDVMENNRAAMRVSLTPHLLVQIIGQILAVNTKETFQCSFACSLYPLYSHISKMEEFVLELCAAAAPPPPPFC